VISKSNVSSNSKDNYTVVMPVGVRLEYFAETCNVRNYVTDERSANYT